MKRMQLLMVLSALSVLSCGLRAETTQPPQPQRIDRSGAQLWTDNCGSCHNLRNPPGYSDAQWDVAMMHMRIRANLTAEESRAILQFLKTAN